MMYFKNRVLARTFAAKTNRKVTDNGAGADKRWSVKVL